MHPSKPAFEANAVLNLSAAAVLVLLAVVLVAASPNAEARPAGATKPPAVGTPPSPVATPGAQLHFFFLPDVQTSALPAEYDVYRGFLVQNVNMRNLAASHKDAVAGPPDYVWDGENQYTASVYHPQPGDPWTANRAFLRYELPEVDAGDVVSAALVLYPTIANTQPGTATLRCGTWTGTPDEDDWDAFGQPLVTFEPVDLGWTWPYTLPVAWDDLVACDGRLALVVDEAAGPGLPPGTRLMAAFVDDTSGSPSPHPWPGHVRVAVARNSNP